MIVEDLAAALRIAGHDVEVFQVPFRDYWRELPQQTYALRMLHFEESDLLIGIRNPIHVVKHHNKKLWFIHHYRGAYDLWRTRYQNIPNSSEGLAVRDGIIQADNLFLREARKIYTNSKVVSRRLQAYNQVSSEVLYPPLSKSSNFYCGGCEDYIFFPSRITSHKRQELAVESMKYVQTPVRLVIAGAPDAPQDLESLRAAILEHGVTDKVQVISRWISEQEKIGWFADCLGCIYPPFDEDSYGYVSLESCYAQKPLITCSDSGGALEIVEHGVNGWVVPPRPKEIAAAMDRLMADRSRARKMGKAGLEMISSLGISWERVVQAFVP